MELIRLRDLKAVLEFELMKQEKSELKKVTGSEISLLPISEEKREKKKRSEIVKIVEIFG
jgi:hypothetical protein